MKRLGYQQFVASGGDWGGIVVDVMAAGPDAPAELIGIHSTFPGVFPSAIEEAIQTHGELPSDLSAAERRAVETLASAYGYAGQAEMAWHPQTLFGLADSPVALAAWLIDHDPISYETLVAPAFVDGREGRPGGGATTSSTTSPCSTTNTGVSASRIYWEHKYALAAVRNVSVPVAVSVFPTTSSTLRRAGPSRRTNLVHYNGVDRGGHFAAWEQPELYASELRGLRVAPLDQPSPHSVYIPSLGGMNRVARTPAARPRRAAGPCCPSRSPPVTSASSSTTSTKTGRHRNGLGAAQPEDKAALLTALGVSVSYDLCSQDARVTCTPSRAVRSRRRGTRDTSLTPVLTEFDAR